MLRIVRRHVALFALAGPRLLPRFARARVGVSSLGRFSLLPDKDLS